MIKHKTLVIFLGMLLLANEKLLYAQNVGIGTTSPNNQLQIGDAAGLTNYHFAIGNGTQAMAFNQETSASTWYSNNNFSLMPSGANTGYLGIGIMLPNNQLQIGDAAGLANYHFAIGNGTQAMAFNQETNASTWYSNNNFSLMPSGANTGYVGIGTTLPNNQLQIGDAAGLANYHFAIGNGTQAMAFNQDATASTWYSNNDFSLMPSGANTGYLGIGTNTPAYPLTLNTSPTVSSWGLFHTNGTVQFGDYIYSTGIAEIGTRSAHPLYIFTNNSDAPPAIAIGVNGLVGLNTTVPQTNLDIHGANTTIRLTDDGSSNIASISRYSNRLEIGVPDIFQVAMGPVANPSFIIKSNGDIGMGDNSPVNKLQIGTPTGFSGNDLAIGDNGKGMSFYQSATASLWYSNTNFALMPNGSSGFVGIGTTTPGTPLEVKSADGTYGIVHSNFSGSVKIGTYVGNSGGWMGTLTNSPLYFFANNSNAQMTVLPNGNVGIGTINPAYKLSVNGTMQTKEVRVETGWADFVFEKNYTLPSLESVENYISQNSHLPGIPSAKEIQEHGLAVGDMQTKTMQKIEELTLYVIELKKEINQLKENNNKK